MKTRYCVVCNKAMPGLHKNSGKKFCEDCRPVQNRTKAKRHYYKNVGKIREFYRTPAQRAKVRWARIFKKYHLTQQQWEEIYRRQDGKCYICLKPSGYFKNGLAVDHLHKPPYTVRGLLCGVCNRYMIGRYTDPTLFDRAAAYLRQDTGLFAPPPQKKKRRKRK